MSGLRSALDELRSEDLGVVGDDQLQEDLGELQRGVRILEAERLRRLAECDRRALHQRSGHTSAGAWVADVFNEPFGRAASDARCARALEDMPVAREALAQGQLSTFAVHGLVAAREASPQDFSRSEAALVDAARVLGATGLRRTLESWEQAVDADRAQREANRRFERRRLFIRQTELGMVRIDGELDPESGQSVITAIRAASPPPRPGDDRTPAQRRADAFVEVCRAFGRPTGRGRGGAELVVTVDVATLAEASSEPARFADVGALTKQALRRLSCDASLVRVVTRGRSEVLDVGRRTPIVSSPIRHALEVRDGGCSAPSCDRGVGWCEAHHVQHWIHGGATTVGNLALLCRLHHGRVHRGELTVRMESGRPVFNRPSRAVTEDRAPP